MVKQATSGDAERLRREGERLRRGAHPGVVQLLRSAPAGDGWELRMAHGGRPLAAASLDTEHAGALVTALATTVADLHDLGVVHGRIDPAHVLVGEVGRGILCGFGPGDRHARPEDDVAALGRILTSLMGAEEHPEPIPERWWGRRSPRLGWERRALLSIADQATADAVEGRPSARRLAALLAAAVPATEHGAASPSVATLDPLEDLHATIAPEGQGRRWWPVALLGGGVLLLVLAGAIRGGRGAESAVRGGAVASTTAAEDQGSVSRSTALPDLEVEAGGRRYRVGQAGDRVLVGDWRCDGDPEPALLRPSTGEVFVFRGWIAREGGRLFRPWSPWSVPATW